ncbi:hypothetical protein MAR_017932 [Mya arenaria]|uniref:Cytochrome b561 domain-containing protein n=1 Tax=Mya arenaria TaxID=6604 RepID=A0ABY7EFW5_MYAAR|nr:hypothetical protein MAR_017932 [Mya arenaria]
MKADESETNMYLALGFSSDLRMSSTGLSGTAVTQSNGVISCDFTRDVSVSGNSQFFDLNTQYRLMLVLGEAEYEDGAWKMEEHHMIPWTSDGKVNFLSTSIYSLYKLNSPLLHRGSMIGLVVFGVIGFIPIFVELEGYSQPVMGLLRPGGDHKLRPLFNWAHLGVGVIGHILAVVATMMGLAMERSDIPVGGLITGLIWLGVIFIFAIIMEVLKWRDNKNKRDIPQLYSVSGILCGDVLFLHRYHGCHRRQLDLHVQRFMTSPCCAVSCIDNIY